MCFEAHFAYLLLRIFVSEFMRVIGLELFPSLSLVFTQATIAGLVK